MDDLSLSSRVRGLVEPVLAEHTIEVVDVELRGPSGPLGAGDRGPSGPLGAGDRGPSGPLGAGDRATILQVTVDRPGGIDLDGISEATRIVSDEVDRHDVLPERCILEVSSPGVERPLRVPEHFRRAVGTTIAVKTRPQVAGERRIEGILEAADDDGIVVGERRLAYADIDRARTVFTWGASATSRKAGAR